MSHIEWRHSDSSDPSASTPSPLGVMPYPRSLMPGRELRRKSPRSGSAGRRTHILFHALVAGREPDSSGDLDLPVARYMHPGAVAVLDQDVGGGGRGAGLLDEEQGGSRLAPRTPCASSVANPSSRAEATAHERAGRGVGWTRAAGGLRAGSVLTKSLDWPTEAEREGDPASHMNVRGRIARPPTRRRPGSCAR